MREPAIAGRLHGALAGRLVPSARAGKERPLTDRHPLDDLTAIRELGSGGMARVWLCVREGVGGFRREVVLKRIKDEYADSEEYRRMFLEEARLMAHLRHSNVVQVHQVGEDAYGPYMVMEYVVGATLLQVVRNAWRRGEADPRHMVALAKGIALGLHHVHQARGADGRPLHLVHRDVSLDNVLVGRDGLPRLADFGIARAEVREVQTRAGVVKGKLNYLAPELVQGDPATVRSDLFAFGVCLYRMVAGIPPFRRTAVQAAREVEGAPPPLVPPIAQPGVPHELVEFVLRLLAADPEARPASAAEVAQALGAIELTHWPADPTGEALRAWLVPLLASAPPTGGPIPVAAEPTRPSTPARSQEASLAPPRQADRRPAGGRPARSTWTPAPDRARPRRLLAGVALGVVAMTATAVVAISVQRHGERPPAVATRGPERGAEARPRPTSTAPTRPAPPVSQELPPDEAPPPRETPPEAPPPEVDGPGDGAMSTPSRAGDRAEAAVRQPAPSPRAGARDGRPDAGVPPRGSDPSPERSPGETPHGAPRGGPHPRTRRSPRERPSQRRAFPGPRRAPRGGRIRCPGPRRRAGLHPGRGAPPPPGATGGGDRAPRPPGDPRAPSREHPPDDPLRGRRLVRSGRAVPAGGGSPFRGRGRGHPLAARRGGAPVGAGRHPELQPRGMAARAWRLHRAGEDRRAIARDLRRA